MNHMTEDRVRRVSRWYYLAGLIFGFLMGDVEDGPVTLWFVLGVGCVAFGILIPELHRQVQLNRTVMGWVCAPPGMASYISGYGIRLGRHDGDSFHGCVASYRAVEKFGERHFYDMPHLFKTATAADILLRGRAS